jgi:hypothetical protein
MMQIIIDKICKSNDIAIAISKTLAIASEAIYIENGNLQYEKQYDKKDLILCEQIPIKGDFLILLLIYPQNSVIAGQIEQIGDLEFASKLCDILNCRCLIAYDSPDPYAWILVETSNRKQYVSLDSRRLDDYEEYILETI